MPTPMRYSVAATVPTRRYLKAATIPLLPPSDIRQYAESEVISRKTYRLNTSPVAVIPSIPVIRSAIMVFAAPTRVLSLLRAKGVV